MAIEQTDALILPLRSLTKTEIDTSVEDWLNDILENQSHGHVYVFAKQMEAAVKFILEKIRPGAFHDLGEQLKGQMTGEILGHKVNLIVKNVHL